MPSHAKPKTDIEALQIPARDGRMLSAHRVHPAGPTVGRIVVAGATGVPQLFYRRFAKHAAGAGFETLTFDYRGIGESRSEPLQTLDAAFTDWAQQDLAGVIDAVPDDGVPLYLVGHSFGGHALGMLPNHDRLSGAWLCAVGAGWAGWNSRAERVRLWALWNVVYPPLVRLKGYMPMSTFGMGEDLPLGVYRQWRHWCQFPHYFMDDPEAGALHEACATVRVPILATTALDDAWAPPASRDAFMLRAYVNAPIERVQVDPQEHGSAIGHVGYFRRSARPLWDDGLAWLQARGV